MNVSVWIARKLRIARSGTARLSAGAVIAISGVAISLMVMEITLGVVTGFKHQIRAKVEGFDAQITILQPYDYEKGEYERYISLTPELSKILEGYLAAQPEHVMQMPGMLKTDDNFAGLVYTAYDNSHDNAFELSNMTKGQWPDFEDDKNDNSIVISETVANELKLDVDDKVYSCFFADGKMKMRRHRIAGIYESNLGEYDKTVVYASLSGLRKVAGVDSCTSTKLTYSGFADDIIDEKAAELQTLLGMAAQRGDVELLYPVTTVHKTGAQYFNWLSLLDTNVVVIFVLMLCVAGFTLVSSLFLIILDRIQTIGLLRALGASKRMINRIFVNMGMRLVVAGMAAGNILGIGICLLQMKTHVIALDPKMYYLKYVPVETDWLGIALLNVGFIIAAWLVLFIPSRSAAKTDPTESLRFE